MENISVTVYQGGTEILSTPVLAFSKGASTFTLQLRPTAAVADFLKSGVQFQSVSVSVVTDEGSTEYVFGTVTPTSIDLSGSDEPIETVSFEYKTSES